MRKYRVRVGSIAWWAKDIFGGITFVSALVAIGCFMYFVAI